MKHLITILSTLLLSSPLIAQSTPKYESVSQCVLQTMTERKLTGNELFEVVKGECERILEKVRGKGKKRQKGRRRIPEPMVSRLYPNLINSRVSHDWRVADWGTAAGRSAVLFDRAFYLSRNANGQSSRRHVFRND